MKLYYDLHIHSALSPCGDGDMTPNNIVNMASLKGLDIIAVSDHNSAKNCRAAVLAAKRNCPDLLVVPAIEAESSEEVHILCLFSALDGAEQMGEALTQSLFLPNKPELFGRQMVLNENDEEAWEEEKLLISASGFSLFEIKDMAESLGRGSYLRPH